MKRELILKEALEKVKPHNRCSIAATMGTGKTLMGLKWIKSLIENDEKFLVVIPKVNLIQSWEEEAKKFNISEVLDNIDFVTYKSLNKKDFNIYKGICLDECHSLTLNHYSWLNKFKGKILGLTGTPPINPYTDKFKMVSKFCPVVYEYTIEKAIEEGILNDYRIIIHKIPLSNTKYIPVNGPRGIFKVSEKEKYDWIDNKAKDNDTDFMKIQRMKTLMSFNSKKSLARALALHYNAHGEKCLVFVDDQKEAEKYSYYYHSNHVNNKEHLNVFNNYSGITLAAVLALSEGTNIKNLKHVVILHAYANERKLAQRLGRAMRLNPFDTCIVDIFVYKDTIDEQWLEQALKTFDSDKITYKNYA